MVSYDIRKLQLTQFDMLKDIHKICEENNINYFIAYGTLLGAVRHKGFIPWDDDIDIMMFSSDYNKFLDICRTKLPKKYFLQNDETDPMYPRMWSKIRINNTCNMEREYRKLHIHYGIDMDIFELVSISDNPIMFELQRKAGYVYRLMKFEKAHDAVDDKFKRERDTKIYKILPKCVKKFLMNLSKKLVYATADKNTKRVVDLSEIVIMEREWFNEKVLLKFEDQKFYAPKKYDELLTNYYGDYMQLPPEDQRTGHGDRIVDFENSYEKYRI
ncbi:MAG: LicD family protein [Clostridium cadaveris]|uniref:Lipopolysaccharide cholinephosphotransferase n=1 Tax=Clostridium cadaveris TaxID=1529 RepID=A0A1I2K2I9_9CLOT|nr:LicD family protein [Clostridium cadaveris]MDU4952757.1 LicD family protein [Clostridium sp.]MDY4948252.1 LicD family protein [Clostridium cadaveris]NME64003.1 LicD family protein [Clostridium cadaveris]NWK12144.1 LicD family protein [Clostridium cadaveris]UFH65501.1 LicD family protein [Clostridium cadaveris]